MESASSAKDAKESLELETLLVREFIDGADQTLIEDGHSEFATNLDGLRKAVSERALTKAGYIVALARGRMLDRFGEAEAASAELKPYILAAQ